jgi:thioredoxin reductase (NADPH)
MARPAAPPSLSARQFSGELAQLSARPSLVDIEAREPVDALVIPSERLRDLLVQEANLKATGGLV